MEDADLRQRLDQIEKKLDATFASAEKTRKYILWTVIVTVALFVLPLIGLVFILPSFINTYAQMGSLLQ
ncbi:MAG TPA: hypothetical protein VN495_02710 [Candidatus Paceibacterota bacterium]|nr:hypothetical protein [Candidatus Paceibacterota bacterium]